MRYKALLIVSIMFITLGPLYAQEIPLYELAVKELSHIKGASLWEETLIETPSPTMVYSGRFLKAFGIDNIRDFLEYLPSFYLVQDVNERVIAWRGLYTTSSNTFLFIEDFQRLDLPSFGSFLLDASYPVKDLSKVEVISGPSSSLYGTNAFSGIVRVERAPDSLLSMYASYGEYQEKLFSTSFNYKDFYGLFHYADLPGEEFHGYSLHPRKDNLATILKGRLFDTTFQLYYFNNKYQTPLSARGEPLTSQAKSIYGSRESGDLFFFNLRKDFEFKGISLHLQPAYTRFKVETPQVRSVRPLNALDITLENERYSLLGYGEKELLGGDFLAGFEFNYIRHLNYRAKLFNGSETVSKIPREEEKNLGLFAQFKRKIGNFTFHLGLRYDSFELWKDKLSPRVALLYHLNSQLALQLNYSEAFNAPPYFYSKANPALGYGSATGLKPELLKNWSLSLLHGNSNNLHLRTTFYYHHLKDKLGYNPQERVYVNLPALKLSGLELEGVYEGRALLGFLNFSTQSVLEGKNLPMVYGNEYIYGIPKWMLKGGLSYKLPMIPHLSVGLAFRWYGKSYYGRERLEPYGLWDGNLLYEREKWNLNFKVENLFDKHYEGAGTVPPQIWEGRKVKLGLEIKY